jgi:hypothetical protein
MRQHGQLYAALLNVQDAVCGSPRALIRSAGR